MNKNIFLFLMLFTFFGCSLDDPKFYHELLPVENFMVPDSFVAGEIYDILVEYRRPTDCHGFDGFFYDTYFSTRTIAIQAIVDQQRPCVELDENTPLSEASFQFKALQHPGSSYIFRFYKGKNQDGENIFEEVLIPVED
ncbi:MAG: hypothetical protein ACK4RM_02795 [Flavobacterium sp.]